VSSATVEKLRKSQEAFDKWKQALEVALQIHILHIGLLRKKKEVQRALRCERAFKRQTLCNQIMENSNETIFHKLIDKKVYKIYVLTC